MSKKRNKVCGIDVHKRFLLPLSWTMKAIVKLNVLNRIWTKLVSLKNWIPDSGCESVAMESTVEYWRPTFGILNPRSMSQLEMPII